MLFLGVGAPAARGCSIEGGRMLFLGPGLPLRGAAGRNPFLGALTLRGAARLKEG